MYFNILFFKKMLFKKRRIIMQQPNTICAFIRLVYFDEHSSSSPKYSVYFPNYVPCQKLNAICNIYSSWNTNNFDKVSLFYKNR